MKKECESQKAGAVTDRSGPERFSAAPLLAVFFDWKRRIKVRLSSVCSQASRDESSALSLAIDNMLQIGRCARLLLRTARLKLCLVIAPQLQKLRLMRCRLVGELRLLRCRLLGELRFQLLELVIRFCQPRPEAVAVNKQPDGNNEPNGTGEPNRYEESESCQNGVSNRFDQGKQQSAGSKNDGSNDAADCIVHCRCDMISDEAHGSLLDLNSFGSVEDARSKTANDSSSETVEGRGGLARPLPTATHEEKGTK